MGRREEAAREAGGPWKAETPSQPLPLCPGIPRNETSVPCAAVPVTREISHNGCTASVSMNDCSGSCGTFAM